MKKRSTFCNILLSYLIILGAPFLFMGGMMFNLFYSAYDQELIDNRVQSLQRTQIIMDNVVEEMRSNAYLLLSSNEFTTRTLRERYGNFYDVARRLSNITFTNTFVDAYYYMNGDLKRIFDLETMYRYSDFSEYCISAPQMTADNMESWFLQNKVSYWLPMGALTQANQVPFLTYVVTRKVSQSPPLASIIFRINKDTLDELMGEISGNEHVCTVMAQKDTILYSSNPGLSDAVWATLQTELLAGNQASYRFQSGGATYMAFQQHSVQSNIQYLSIISYHDIVSSISTYRQWFFAGCLLIAILCSLLIARFMKVNYATVHSVSRLINAVLHTDTSTSDTDDLEHARLALMEIREQNRTLLRDEISIKLLRSGIQTLEQLDQESSGIDYDLYGPFFVVALLQMKDDRQAFDSHLCQSIGSFWASSLSTYVSCQFLIFFGTRSIVFLMSGEPDELDCLTERLPQVKSVVDSTWGLHTTVGVGTPVAIDQIALSYTQAGNACEYKALHSQDRPFFYSQIKNADDLHLNYPKREIENLHHAILQGDKDRVCFAVQTLRSYIYEVKSLFYCTCIAYDILNTAIKAMQELNCDVAELDAFKSIQQSTPQSLEGILSIMEKAVQWVTETLDQQSQQDVPEVETALPVDLTGQIIQHILQHYRSDAFSAKTLADHCNMSVSNLSHYFKKRTGQTVSEYIAMLRFEKAKEYLRTTDMNLQRIAEQCGYLHLSTFMRQFKLREGCTPCEYRSNHQ